ncbi:MAG: hypothetical protein Q4Q06_07070 [Bacteroidota bacterium]|nr:hypothetical protein [Bacteroidota bacterium]
MKKNYFLLIPLVLLFICSKGYAQMQGINASSERYVRSLQAKPEFVKVERISNKYMLTSLQNLNSIGSTFVKTKEGSDYIELGNTSPGFMVYDFKYFDNYVYFCGEHGSNGFIAWATLDDIFNSGNFDYERLPTVGVVYNLEVFVDPTNEKPKVVALGYETSTQNYSFIDYNVWNNTGTYDVYETPFRLQNLTQTKEYIAVVFSDITYPYKYFGVMKHQKVNISNCQSRMFEFANGGIATGDLLGRLPEYNKASYLIEWIEGSPNVMVATCIDQLNSPSLGYPIALFNIDLDNFNLYSTQIIPNDGKPYVKDMVYMPYDKTMHLLINGQFGDDYSNVPSGNYKYTDFIHKINVWETNGYLSEILLPNSNTDGEDILNSITRYDRYYYMVGGVLSGNSELYWFDRRIDVSGSQCYVNYETKVYFNPPQLVGSITYSPNPIPSSVSSGSFLSSQRQYIKICSD